MVKLIKGVMCLICTSSPVCVTICFYPLSGKENLRHDEKLSKASLRSCKAGFIYSLLRGDIKREKLSDSDTLVHKFTASMCCQTNVLVHIATRIG